MSAFHYQALTEQGQTTKGILEADSARHARQLLRGQGLYPTDIKPLTKQVKHKRGKISPHDLSLVTRQLATLLAAGIPLEEALQGVCEQNDNEKTRAVMIGVRTKVLEGYSLAQALADFPQTFPELYCATIAAGEQTGRLDLILEKLADYTENQQVVYQKIQQALIYPLLMIGVSITIISFLLAFVVPKIIEVFTNSGQSLPLMTSVLISFSDFIRHYGLYLLLALILAIFAIKRLLRNLRIKKKVHQYLLYLPFCAYLIKSTTVARYIHTFGILFAASVSVLETMRVASSVVNNLIIREAFEKAAIQVREGKSISTALKDTHYLSPMALHLIGSGEKSGQISPMMQRAAAYLDTDVKRIIDTGLTLLEPLIILMMGAVVLFIVLATLLPIFSMEQLVT